MGRHVFDFWLTLSLNLRLALLAIFGLLSGALANHVIYTWCWFARPISPWAPPSPKSPRRLASDRIPLVGWLSLRREAALHGRGFWIRPLLIEIGLAIAIPALYMFETQNGGLLAESLRVPQVLSMPWLITSGHRVFLGHAVLLVLMVAATFIDFDEQTIPDEITIPGTLFALLLGSISDWGFMPISLPIGGPAIELARATFEAPWFPALEKWWTSTGLLTGLAIWSGWCFALADRRLILRKGFGKAIEFFLAGLVRHSTWKLLLAIWVAGLIAISIIFQLGGAHWHGLFSALVGLAVGGGVIWAIRIIASGAMGMEAMGFGDVTLMAMIGAFLGWQAAVAAFFLSPFAAIVIVVFQFIITREPRVPFGPYLCAGAAMTVIGWDRVMNQWFLPNLSILGGFILWLCLAMLGLMGIMLFVWRQIKQRLFP